MAIDFPASPSNGDTYSFGGVNYVYDSTPGIWRGSSSGTAVVSVGGSVSSSTISPELFLAPHADVGEGTYIQFGSNTATNSGFSGNLTLSGDTATLAAPSSGSGILYAWGAERNGTSNANNVTRSFVITPGTDGWASFIHDRVGFSQGLGPARYITSATTVTYGISVGSSNTTTNDYWGGYGFVPAGSSMSINPSNGFINYRIRHRAL